jgi:hypothetical protein
MFLRNVNRLSTTIQHYIPACIAHRNDFSYNIDVIIYRINEFILKGVKTEQKRQLSLKSHDWTSGHDLQAMSQTDRFKDMLN